MDVNRYISELLEVPTGVKNLADLIAFNTAHADEELVPPFWTDQSQYAHCQIPPCPPLSSCAPRIDSMAILIPTL